MLDLFDSAEGELVYMTVEELLTEDLIEGSGEAAERDVSIKLGGVSTEVQERIRDEIPDATMFESLWVWSDTSAGRLMMVDGRKNPRECTRQRRGRESIRSADNRISVRSCSVIPHTDFA